MRLCEKKMRTCCLIWRTKLPGSSMGFRLFLFLILALLATHTTASPTSHHSISTKEATLDYVATVSNTASSASMSAEPMVEVWSAHCIYPISGLYTRFQRILYYTILLVVFLFRSRKWVLIAGATWIAGYTLTAALHGFALAASPDNGLDADLLAIGSILDIGVFVGALFALFPPTDFRFATSVVAATWALFLMVAGFCVSIKWTLWYESGVRVQVAANATECSNSDSLPGLSADVCGAAGYVPAIFRGAGDQLQPFNWTRRFVGGTEFPELITTCDDATSAAPGLVGVVLLGNAAPAPSSQFYMLFPMIVVLSMILSLTILIAYLSPRIARNWMVRRITAPVPHRPGESRAHYAINIVFTSLLCLLRVLSFFFTPLYALELLVRVVYTVMTMWCSRQCWLRVLHTPKTPPACPPAQALLKFAKIIAILCYIVLMLGYLASPSLLAFKIMTAESTLAEIPEQEDVTAVGQWSPWLCLCLVVCLALYARFSPKGWTERLAKKQVISLHELELGSVVPATQHKSPPAIKGLPDWALRHLSWLLDRLRQVPRGWEELKTWWKDPFTVAWLDDPSDPTRPKVIPEQKHWRSPVQTGKRGEDDDAVFDRAAKTLSVFTSDQVQPGPSQSAPGPSNLSGKALDMDRLSSNCSRRSDADCPSASGGSGQCSTEDEQQAKLKGREEWIEMSPINGK